MVAMRLLELMSRAPWRSVIADCSSCCSRRVRICLNKVSDCRKCLERKEQIESWYSSASDAYTGVYHALIGFFGVLNTSLTRIHQQERNVLHIEKYSNT